MKSSVAGILLLLATVLTVAGCGGGGGGPAGNTTSPNTVAGKVTVNGSGLGGVTLNLTGGRVEYSDGNGNYTIANLSEGAHYTITPYKVGYRFTPVSQTVVAGKATVVAQTFTAEAIQTYSISGTVASLNGGLNGVSLTVTNKATGAYAGATTSNGAGLYMVGGLLDGEYLVTPSHPNNYSFTPADVVVSGANAGANFSVPVATHTVSGKVLLSGQGLANVVITMSSTDQQHPMYSAVSGTDGSYSISGLPDGFYGLWPVRTGYNFVENNGVHLNGADATNDITAALPPGNGGSADIGL